MPTDKRIFVNPQGGAWKGGMDKNSSPRYVQNGHYTDARNVSFMVNGDRFVVTNLKGNTEVAYNLRDSYGFCIGAHENKGAESIYFFIFGGSNTHQILKYEYNKTSATVTELSYGFGLNFDKDYPITGTDIVQDRFLVWTDNLNEVGCIDLDNYATLTAPITSADRWEIELYKVPNPVPLEPHFGTIKSKNNNALTNKIYKFRTRYIYEGGFRTHASTVSRLAVIDFSWEETSNSSRDNVIYMAADLPDYNKVEKIEFFVQAGESDDTMGDWYKFKEVLYSDIAQDTFQRVIVAYTGEQQLEAADQTEINQPYSFIPPKCKEVVFLPSNVLAFMNTTDTKIDAESLDLKVQAYPIYNTIPTASAATTTAPCNNTGIPVTGSFVNVNYNILLNSSLNYIKSTIGGTPKIGDSISILFTILNTGTMPITPTTVYYNILYIVKSGDTTSTIAANMADLFNSGDTRDRGFGGLVAYSTFAELRIVYGVNVNQTPYAPSSTVGAVELVQNLPNYVEKSSRFNMKRFASHNIALQYEDDKGRRTGALPAATMYSAGFDDTTNLGNTSAKVVIGHIPPDNAVGYHILYSKNTTYAKFLSEWVLCYVISEVTFDTGSGSVPFQGADIINTTVLGSAVYIKTVDGENEQGRAWIAITSGTLFSSGHVVTFNTSSWTATLTSDATANGTVAFNIFDVVEYNRLTYGVLADEYNYVEGDRVKLLGEISSGFTYFSKIPDTNISDADIQYVYAKYDVSTLTPSITDGVSLMLVEFWRPKSSADPSLYYEVGQYYTISGGYHNGRSQNQTASQGAIIELTEVGDSYFAFTTSSASSSALTENESMVNFFKSSVTPIGRSNFESASASSVVVRPTAIEFTQPVIPNSPTNGLSMALGTSIAEYDLKFGGIQKALIRNDKQLIVYFEDKVGQIGILSELAKSQSGDVTYQTDALFNGINYYAYDGGVGLNPESISYYDNTQYFLSPRNNAVCRLADDGITEISKWGMTKWFNENLDVKDNYIGTLYAQGVYDERHESYILSLNQTITSTSFSNQATGIEESLDATITNIGNPTGLFQSPVCTQAWMYDTSAGWVLVDLLSFTIISQNVVSISWYNGEGIPIVLAADVTQIDFILYTGTLMFSEPANAWASFLDFNTEKMATCGVDFVSFKSGALWLHNSNETRGSYYGVEYPAEVTIPFNTSPDVQKKFENVEQEANSIWKSDTDGDITTVGGQTSLLEEAFYEEFQPNEFAAGFRQDSSTPNETYPLLNGYDLRDRVLSMRLVNANTTKATLEAVAVSFSVSESSQ